MTTPGPAISGGYRPLDDSATGGLTLAIQGIHGDHSLWFIEGEALPLGGYYMGRAGIILGWRRPRDYYLWIGSSSTTIGNTVYTTNTYEVHPGSQIDWVFGLDLAVSAYHTDRGDAPVLEGGFGAIGQHRIDVLGLYDLSTGTPGVRITVAMFAGDHAPLSLGWRLGCQGFFEFKDHPVPMLLTFGFGPGGSFHQP